MELSRMDRDRNVTYFDLNDREWGQYLLEGKPLPEIVAERPGAALTAEQAKDMLADRGVNAEPEEPATDNWHVTREDQETELEAGL